MLEYHNGQQNVPDEIKQQVTSLIELANGIVYSFELSPKEKALLYENSDTDAKSKIDVATNIAKQAKESLDTSKKLPKATFVSIGRNKEKIEQTNITLDYVLQSVDSITDAVKSLFNQVVYLSAVSRNLIGLGVMNVAANRMIVREIKLRLEKASEEEISDLARKELEGVLRQLTQQQDVLRKVEAHGEKLSRIDLEVARNTESLNAVIEQLSKKGILDSVYYKVAVGLLALIGCFSSLIILLS